MRKNNALQYTIWGIAALAVFLLLVAVGTKIFYGFAAFPAYIAYFLSSHGHSAENAPPYPPSSAKASAGKHALKIGIAASLGIFSFYCFVRRIPRGLPRG